MEEGFRQESSKLRIKRKKDKMAEEQRGRIVQSTGRKDRHSKVSTAKGPRDRRVRLSAHTAIRFYDVQDRLGCDRPSKAIDWLMKEAKAAIDALGELPTRNPNYATTMAYQPQQKVEEHSTNLAYGFQNQQQMDNHPTNSFSFSSSIDFDNYPHGLNSRSISQTHENNLSLQSFQENPILLQQHSHLSLFPSGDHQSLFSASTAIDFNAMPDMGWFQRMVTLNPNSNSGICKGSEEGSVADSQQVLVQTQLFSQREPLQSSFSASICMPEFNPPLVTSNLFGNDGLSGFSVSPQFEGQLAQQNSFLNQPSSAKKGH